MKKIVILLIVCNAFSGYAQEEDLALRDSNDLVYEGNELIAENKFVSAEMEYRKAISKKPSNAVANYDLGNAYYNDGKFNEALLRHIEATEFAKTKEQKHKAWHNVGNTLMKSNKCQEAVEAFKNALRNNPNDEETRYNFGLAKACAKQQEQENEDQKDKEDKKDEDKDKENKDGENENEKDDGEQEEKDNEGNEDKENEGDDKKDENGDPKDNKQDENKDGKPEDQNKKPQPQPGQLSPQQIKNLLEAMNNQEQKVQEKINAKKTKGVKLQTDKDW